MIVTSMLLVISSRRDIAVLQKESPSLPRKRQPQAEVGEDVNAGFLQSGESNAQSRRGSSMNWGSTPRPRSQSARA